MSDLSNLIPFSDFKSTTNAISIVNGSEISNICPPLRITALIITSGIVASCIIIGNCLVILAIGGGSARFSRPMYWFIIHLSFSDFLVGVMLIWNFCLAAIFNINNSLTSLLVLQGVWVTSTVSSTLGILFLAIDRYMQVVHRHLHTRYFTRCSVGWTIAFAWFLPCSVYLVTPLAFGWSCQDTCRCHKNFYMECLPFSDCSLLIPPLKKTHILFGLIFLYVVMPWPILIYSLIFIKSRKSTQMLQKRISKRDIRLIQTLIVIMTVFLVTLAPTGVVMMLDYLNAVHDTKLVNCALFVFVVAALNSLANPILYLWRIPAIRASLRSRFRCCFGGSRMELDWRTTRTRRGEDLIMSSNQASPTYQHSPPLSSQPAFCFHEKASHSEESDSSPVFKRTLRKKRGTRRLYEMSNIQNNSKRSVGTPRSPLCGEARVTREGKSFRIHPEGHRDGDAHSPPDSSSLLQSSPPL